MLLLVELNALLIHEGLLETTAPNVVAGCLRSSRHHWSALSVQAARDHLALVSFVQRGPACLISVSVFIGYQWRLDLIIRGVLLSCPQGLLPQGLVPGASRL